MSKKEKSKKNVFGLVSKLGNLIKGSSSSNNSDTSSGENEIPKKNYNVHISEDNQEQIELGDEEEEEEEEEENTREEKKELKETKTNSDEKNYKNKINDENKNIDKDNKNTVNEINKEISNVKKEDNKIEEKEKKELNENVKKEEMKDDNKKEEIKDSNNINQNIEKIEEKNNILKEENKEKVNEIKNIIEENKSNINNDINEKKINEENITETNDISKNNEESIKEEDINEACHLYLKKGNDFNYKDIYCFSITKIKLRKKKSLFQKINVFKKAKNEIIKYIIFFEDNFIYLANDIIIDKNNDEFRRINKIYNIRDILSYTSNRDEKNKKYKITFEIMNKKNIKKNKEYFIEEQYFEEFNDELMTKLKLYGDKLNKNEE